MSEQEKLEFCGTICWAASELGFAIQRVQEGGSVGFWWLDRLSGTMLACGLFEDPKEALFASCNAFVESISIQPKSK